MTFDYDYQKMFAVDFVNAHKTTIINNYQHVANQRIQMASQ